MHKLKEELLHLFSIWCPEFKDKRVREAIRIEVHLFFNKIEAILRKAKESGN